MRDPGRKLTDGGQPLVLLQLGLQRKLLLALPAKGSGETIKTSEDTLELNHVDRGGRW